MWRIGAFSPWNTIYKWFLSFFGKKDNQSDNERIFAGLNSCATYQYVSRCGFYAILVALVIKCYHSLLAITLFLTAAQRRTVTSNCLFRKTIRNTSNFYQIFWKFSSRFRFQTINYFWSVVFHWILSEFFWI